MPFKCDLVMDTPSSFIPHEHCLVGVKELIDFSGNFSLLSSFIWLV